MSQLSEPDGTDPWAKWYGPAAADYGQAARRQPLPNAPASPPGYGAAGNAATGNAANRYSATGGILAESKPPILVQSAAPARQRRATVLLRALLAIPPVVMLSGLFIALEVVAVIGWFVALATGRLPAWAHTFSTGVLRWQARVSAYLFMLTDAYPPFSLDDDAYPVRLAARQAKLSRAAVLFRLILAIPATIVAAVAGSGLAVLSLAAWLIALVTGRLPAALHQAATAIIRYVARSYGYFFMVTDEYPAGLYGDKAASGLGVVPAAGAEAVVSVPSAGSDSGWQLALSAAAKALVTVALLLGAAAVVGYGILGVTLPRSIAHKATNLYALTRVAHANSVLGTSMRKFPAAVQACGGQLTCVTALDVKLGRSLATFAGSVRALRVTGSAAGEAVTVVSAASVAAHDLNRLGSATSVAQYQAYARNDTLQQDLNDLSTDYARLVADLGPS
jgi:Domain of unknown function (DUF4389)